MQFRTRVANLSAMRSAVQGQLPPKVMRQWGVRYQSHLRERYMRFARGGGNWKPLAQSTILARRAKGGGSRRVQVTKLKRQLGNLDQSTMRKLSKARSAGAAVAIKQQARARRSQLEGRLSGQMSNVSILWNTGTLLRALSFGDAGSMFEQAGNSVRVGFSGAKTHRSGKATLAQIAAYHSRGGRRLPQRRIIVGPDQQTLIGMADDLKRATGQVLSGFGLSRKA